MKNALNYLKFDYSTLKIPGDLGNFSHLILPGVGSFEAGISKLKKLGWESKIKDMSDESFSSKTAEFKSKVAKGVSLEDLIPETFACVREASRRTLSERHFDVQLMGGIILHQGKIAEMKTGEGKTLVSTLPVYLNSLIKDRKSVV